jgi:hypothetical protein
MGEKVIISERYFAETIYKHMILTILFNKKHIIVVLHVFVIF